MGFVRAFSGPSPGPAVGITYEIEWNDPACGPMKSAGQRPASWRWPDPVDVDASMLLGKLVSGYVLANNVLYWNFLEPVAVGCDSGVVLGGRTSLQNPLAPPVPSGTGRTPVDGPPGEDVGGRETIS